LGNVDVVRGSVGKGVVVVRPSVVGAIVLASVVGAIVLGAAAEVSPVVCTGAGVVCKGGTVLAKVIAVACEDALSVPKLGKASPCLATCDVAASITAWLAPPTVKTIEPDLTLRHVAGASAVEHSWRNSALSVTTAETSPSSVIS